MPSPSISTSKYPTATDELAVRPRGLTTHPESTITRINKASTLDALVTHNAPGIYSVENSDDTYTVNLLNDPSPEPTATCTCPDYIYRCAEANIDCKHILLVKRRIQENNLAPPSVNPEVWMQDYTDSLLYCLTALDLSTDTRTRIENTLLLAGEHTYDIDPRALARWTLIQTQH